ncbi:uncharacterized protein LOC116952053 isoform X2 [Petromyzon marinus]|uniref:uncharacterized protein LOC116952053 isoform X2 n=1 Tax=Petromyzon marinus TaxID=7757 RepID=UPI003F7195CB
MSYTQFGYPYTTTTQLLVSSPPSSSVIPGIISGISNNNNSSSSSILSSSNNNNSNNNSSSNSSSSGGGGITSPCYDSNSSNINRGSNSAPVDGSTGSTPGSRVATGPATPPPLHPSAVAAPTVCCSPYNSRLLASAAARGDLTALGVYGGSYAAAAAAQGYGNYVPYGAEPSAFYSPLTSPYEIKDSNGSLHTGLPQATGYYHYDGSLNQYQYGRYGGVDLSAGTRRKNATRETTATLKAWLYEHRKNPYPTKGEKIMLAIITKMTLTQVSTWFANARRRLKKENKMTWSPRSRPGEESGGKDECRREVDREQQQQQQHEEDEEQEAAVVVDKRGGVVKCFVSDHNGEKDHGKGHVLSDLEDLDDVESDHLGDDELEEGGHLQAKRFQKSQCKNYPPLAVVDASSINTSSNTSTTNNNNSNSGGGGGNISINIISGGGGGSGVQQTSEGIKSVFALSCGEQQDSLQLYDSSDQQQQQQHQQHHHHHHHQHHHQHHQVVSSDAKSLLPIVSEKPRIWSLAHTVSSCDSKYPSCAALQQLQQQQQQQQQSPVSGSQATAGTLLQRHQKFHATLSQLSPPCSDPVGSWRQVASAASPEQLLLKAAEQNGLGSYLLAQQQQQLQQQQLQQQQQQQQQQQLAQVQHGLLSRASCQMSGLHMGAQQHQELTSAKSQAAANSHRHSTEVDAIRSKIQGTETGFAWSARP